MKELTELLTQLYNSETVGKHLAKIVCEEVKRGRANLTNFLAVNDTSLSQQEISRICDLAERAMEQAAG